MNRRELLGALRSMAGERPEFLLSDMLPRAGKGMEIGELRRTLEPHLDSLGLIGEERGEDLLVFRLPPASPSVPTRGALVADSAFLRHPSIPGRLQELIEAYIGRKTGKSWDDPVVLDRIRAAIRAQKGEYWDQGRGRPISYRAGYRVLAYLAYQFPVVFVQSLHLLHEMAGDGLLKERMRILDMGSGPGTFPLAIADAWSRLSPGRVRIFALEQETENLEAWRSLVPAFASGNPTTVGNHTAGGNPAVQLAEPLQGDLRSLDPGDLPGEMDLMVFGNVLSELRELSPGGRAALVERCAGALAGDGTVLVMEPADLENAVALRRLAHALGDRGFSVYAPCTPLWNTACRPDRCWTFREAPRISPPRLMSALASSEDGYRYLNTDIKFSYALLRRDGTTRESYRIPRGTKALRLSKLQGHLKRRVNVVVAKMSGDLGGGRGHYVFKVCDGTPQKPVF
ncbi:MAG: small ribosomal subunit Rsm22 family protein, partial [Methanomicrobiales archaeon]|nr:small ribosomal subunit Rsm22 family protein [Methanomicrobiales archaeon]